MEGRNELPASELSPEEIAQMEKSRTISDSELLKKGAEYSVNENGEKNNLITPEEHIENLRKIKLIEKLNLKQGEGINLTFQDGKSLDFYYVDLMRTDCLLVVSEDSEERLVGGISHYKLSEITDIVRISE